MHLMSFLGNAAPVPQPGEIGERGRKFAIAAAMVICALLQRGHGLLVEGENTPTIGDDSSRVEGLG